MGEEQLPLFEDADRTEISIADSYGADAIVTLYNGDRLDLLRQIQKTGSQAELIVTSPPYNVGKEYEKVLPLEHYLDEQQKTIDAALQVLSPTGSICWQVGHYIEGSKTDKEAFPLDLVLYPIFKSFGLKLRNRIVWTFGHGLHENHRLSGRHETILWFTRDTNDYTFNLDPIRVPQKYPGKRAFRGEKRGELTGNPLGKNPGDVWDMPNVKSNHIEKTEHPCQFPMGLVERLILGLTNPGDLVIDPYIGVGTTAAACVLTNRKVAGADTEARYLAIARQRVTQAARGHLKYRPMNEPVYVPDLNTAVARLPKEWKNDEAASQEETDLLWNSQ